jgi:hypothetical protein
VKRNAACFQILEFTRKKLIGAAIAASTFACLAPRSASAAPDIENHVQRRDTAGNLIDCHEGGMLRIGSTFYWYGREYKGNVFGIYGAEGAQFRGGINCYSSTDLVNWTNRGQVLSYPSSGFLTGGTWHRPRVLFNAPTGKYVLWFFMFPDGTADTFTAVVATSGSPTGPFTVQTGPGFHVSGDLALLQDQDGQGYIAYDNIQNRQILVSRLTGDFRNLTGSAIPGLPDGAEHEGTSLARYKGKYIVAGSGVAGLSPTDTSYAVADSIMGPYTPMGLMSEQNTWSSQISSFVYVAESDRLFAMCEQWLIGPNGEQVPAEESCQLWLPVTFDPATGVAMMEHVDRWDPWAPEGGPPPNQPPAVSITTPANGTTFTAPANLAIQATASDSDGTVAQVQFYQGATLLGADTTSPYSFAWNGVSAGSYSLTAVATDNGGATTTSGAVNITVSDPPPGDSDADGLSDSWEIQYFGDLSQTAADDPDGDGRTNLQEYQGGTDPTVPDPTNLLANPDFEGGATGWKGISGSYKSLVGVPTHSGAQALQILASATSSPAVNQWVGATEGASYTASGWVQTDSLTAGARVQAQWRNAANSTIRTDLVGGAIKGTQGWTQVTRTVTAPAGTTRVYFRLLVTKETDGSGAGWFDDLSLVQTSSKVSMAAGNPVGGDPEDVDGDGLFNEFEAQTGLLSPQVLDTDGNGISDDQEKSAAGLTFEDLQSEGDEAGTGGGGGGCGATGMECVIVMGLVALLRARQGRIERHDMG